MALESAPGEVVEKPRTGLTQARSSYLRWNDRLLFRASFVQALLETFGLALGLQSLAWLWDAIRACSPN